MIDNSSIPGYLTLTEAEKKYGMKADTLKKRCQKGEVVGAKKVGKTWFVPQIPGVDPEKTIPENYPTLNFDAAITSNSSLYDAENEAKVVLYYANKKQVYIWEYGYYFFSLIFKHGNVHRSYLPFAALITEAHSGLRASFLLNLEGYHSDALALQRKTHECIIKVLAMKTEPKQFWKIGFSTSRQQSEHKIGVDFSSPWNLESSFNHANLMKLFEAGRGAQDPAWEPAVSYGPQIDDKQFRAAMNTGIFWLYVLIKSLPYIFPGQISSYWLNLKDDSAKLLRDHLTASKALKKEIESFDVAIAKLQNRNP